MLWRLFQLGCFSCDILWIRLQLAGDLPGCKKKHPKRPMSKPPIVFSYSCNRPKKTEGISNMSENTERNDTCLLHFLNLTTCTLRPTNSGNACLYQQVICLMLVVCRSIISRLRCVCLFHSCCVWNSRRIVHVMSNSS